MVYSILIVIITLIITYGAINLLHIYLIKPNKHRESADFFAEHLYAHRGLFDNEQIPENSLSAFKKAKEFGYGVELDVQLTADRKAVVFHDENLNRMCGVDKKLYLLTYDELCEYKLKDTEEKIPLFTDVLDLLGDTPIICELKIYVSNKDLSVCETVNELIKDRQCRLCIESFNPFAVEYFRKNNPEIVRGQLSMSFKRKTNVRAFTGFILTNLLFNFRTKPDFIAFNHIDSNCFSFSRCKKLFNPLCFAWTICSEEEAENASTDFDTIIFERFIPKNEKGENSE